MTTWEVLTRRAWLPFLIAATVTGAQTEPSETATGEAADTTHADTTVHVNLYPNATRVSGDVSGRWDRGTYLVTDNVRVPGGDSLTIAAGCSVLFMPPKAQRALSVTAYGRLDILGTSERPILFASAQPPDSSNRLWDGVLYVGNLAEGRVEHAIFKRPDIAVQVRRGLVAETGRDSGSTVPDSIRLRPTGPVLIHGCTVDSASFTGIVLAGVRSTVVIDDNLIHGSSNGISCEDSAAPVITKNRIIDNTSTGILCTGGSSPSIAQCMIVGSQTAGIICASESNPTIDLCVIARCGIGISATKANPRITRCTIAWNDFSGIIAYEDAAPEVSASNIRGNGLAGIDNRSTATITASRVWWGFITTETRLAPVLDSGTRRKAGETVPPTINGQVVAAEPLSSPSLDAPGTPSEAQDFALFTHGDLRDRFATSSTVSNGDSIWIQMVAKDESPYLEDEATILITTPSNPQGTQRVLTESGPATGTYRGYIIASLLEGNPNIVVKVRNGDVIRVQTGTTPPLSGQVTFMSKPPLIQALRVNGQPLGARLLAQTPLVATWRYWDTENDPEAGVQLELHTKPGEASPAVWQHQETGQVLSYTYDGTPLTQGTTYYLRVQANDGYNWGAWREASFHVNVPPTTPTAAYPENGATVRLSAREQKPALAVNNVVDSDGDRVSFIFEAFYGEDFRNARLRVTDSTRVVPVPQDTASSVTVWSTMPQLMENTRVWWRAKATDGLETSAWSVPCSFLLNSVDDAPEPFAMLDPPADSTVRTTQPRFEWQHSYDPDPGEQVTFVLTYAKEPTLSQGAVTHQVEAIPEPTQFYQVLPEEALQDNTNYYWTVSAQQNGQVILEANSDGTGTSQVWRFFLDTGNDPPSIEPIPMVTMQEDEAYRLRMGRYVSDPDNAPDQLTLTARSTPHITAQVLPNMEVMLTPQPNWNGGPETVRLMVSDPRKSMGIGDIAVQVAAVNDPPTAQPVPDQVVDEDTDLRLDLTPCGSDIDDRPEDLTWTASTDERKLSIAITRGIATIRGTSDWFGGPVNVQLTVTDTGKLTASTSANVTVNPVNDAPRVTQIPPQTFREDESFTLDLDNYVNDPDNTKEELTWAAAPDEPLQATIDPGSHVAAISAPQNWSGSQRRVVFTVQDPAGLSNQIVALFEVQAVNDPPVVAGIPDQQFNEDDSVYVELDQYMTDPDNSAQEMAWSAANSEHVLVRIDQARRRAHLRTPHNWYGGPEHVRIAATDPGGLRAEQAVGVTVISVPEAPVFTQIPPASFPEDSTYVIPLDRYLSDPDHTNAEETLAIAQPAHVRATLDARTRQLTLSAPLNWNGGPETVRVTVTDPDRLQDDVSFPVTVTPVNDAPVLAEIPIVAFDEDSAATLKLTDYVSDPDNTPEQMEWAFSSGANVHVQVAGGIARFTADKDWNGSRPFTATARDPGGLAATRPVNVVVRPVNDPPVLSALPPVQFDEDLSTTVNLNQYVADVDNTADQMRWTVTGNVHVKVNVVRGTATFTADRDWNGQESLSLTATDPGGLAASVPVQVTVNAVNDAPVVTQVPPAQFDEDQSIVVEFAPLGSDADGDALTWTATSGAPNVIATVAGSQLTLSAAQDWNGGPVPVTVTATDPGGLSASQRVQVTVRSVNDAPVLAALPPVRFDEDGSTVLNLNEYGTDVDDTPTQLRWAVTGNIHVKISIARGTATFTAERDWNGTETVTFTVSDRAGLTVSGTAQVTVSPVNDPPAISRINPVQFDEDQSTVVDLAPFGSDVDGDALTWAASTINPNLTLGIAGSQLTLSATKDWNGGPVDVAITATDPSGAQARGTVRVTVRPVNDPPVLSPFPPVQFDEDGTTTLALAGYVTDPDDAPGQIRWTAANGSYVRVRVSNGIATFTATENWFGSERIVLTATDRGGLTASGEVTVTVNPVNDPPEVSAIPDINLDAGSEAELLLSPYASDPEGSVLRWNIEELPPGLDLTLSDMVLRVRAPSSYRGTAFVRVSVSDGSMQVTARVKINVRAAQTAGAGSP